MTTLMLHAITLLLLFSMVLGITKPRGRPCQPHSQPWQAAIYEGFRFNCGATLINQAWVLTAAHCNCGSIHVRLGKVNLDVLDSTEQFKIVAKTVIHPDFNHTSHDNDIMLVKLLSPAELNCYVHPIGLATHRTSPGEQCLVSGWGTPINYPGNIPLLLYCAAVRIIPFKKCAALYSGNVNYDMFCAASLEGGTDSCEGDSGGPLVCNGKLQGVVSWGDVPCISTTKPGVYMDVFRYRDWIDKVMRDN